MDKRVPNSPFMVFDIHDCFFVMIMHIASEGRSIYQYKDSHYKEKT